MARKTALRNAPDFHVHSSFSTYDGMGSPKAVVERAVELRWGAACLTEHGWLGSAPILYQEARKAKIKPIIGCEMYVVPDHYLVQDKSADGQTRHLTVLALSTEGYQNLVAWANFSMLRESFRYKPRISLDKMAELAPWPLHHNAVLSGCIGSELAQAVIHANGDRWYVATSYVEACKALFPNFYIEVQNHRHDKFYGHGFENYDKLVDDQAAVRDYLLALAQHTDTPVILTNDSHYQSGEQRKAHIAMLARKDHRRPREAHHGSATEQIASGYALQYAYWRSFMQPMEPIFDTLPSWAAKQAVESIQAIVAEADIRLDPLDTFSYTIPRSGYQDPVEEVRRRSRARLKSLVAAHGEEARERFEYELDAMKDFAHYLLLVSDIVRMAREQGIYTWTRGSAANSIVCFCLHVHDIDSIHYKLLFERFVNPARKKLPDIDVDFEKHRQPDVAKLVMEHMAALEGDGNVRPICTYSTVSNRAAFRLMAESAGVSKERIDELAKLLPQMIDSGMVSDEEEAYELLREEVPELHGLAEQVFDAIGNVSQHACAFALGTEDRPLDEWVPDYLIASSNTLVTQYNMATIEALGFLKLDLLKLDTLSIMHNVARMLGKDMKWLDDILRDGPGSYGIYDEPTYAMLRQGRTEGVHSFQGPTQRRGGIEVSVESDFDMVAVQALYRPSGTRTGFDKQFVNRKHNREDWEVDHPLVAKTLNETYGLPIYQEQILEIGKDFGMSGEEIDDLYKAIKTAKGVGRGAAELFEEFKPTFMRYALEHMEEDDAEELWRLFDAFQGYGFNRGHATSYALLALKTAYLKAHYPQEFFTALLERYPDNPRYLAAAMSEGFAFESPDVNTSSGGFSRGTAKNTIQVGLLRVLGVGPGAVGEIVRNQPFASLDDLRERTQSNRVDSTVIENLGRVGALETLGIRGERDDVTDFELLKFCLRRPVAFRGCKPSMGRRNGGRSWQFLGLTTDVVPTTGKAFCAKLFWIPPVGNKLYSVKASAMGKFSAHLLTVVDVNGIPFDLIVAESKKTEGKLAKLLFEFAQGAVICAEGQIAMPFLRGGNPGFKLWGITGAENGNPQMWHCTEETAKEVIRLAQEKRAQRR